MSETVESDFWSGSIGAGSGGTEGSPFSPATTPGLRGSATPCQDFDPAELASSAAAPILPLVDENEPLALIPDSQSDIFDEDTQLRLNTGGEDDGGSGNASPYERDVPVASLKTQEPLNALSDNEDESVRGIARDPSPCLSQGTSSGQSENNHDHEVDDRDAGSGKSAKTPRSTKRKQPSSHAAGPVQKRKRRLQTSTSYTKARLDSACSSDRSDVSHNGDLTCNTEHETKGRLPSPVPYVAHTIHRGLSSTTSGSDQPSLDNMATLTEITFRPWSPHSCSFTAVIEDGCDGNGASLTQLAQLIKGIGYIGELEDFTIKPLQQESLLLTGVCHHPASQLVPGYLPTLPRQASVHTPSSHAARARRVRGRPVQASAEKRGSVRISDDESLSDHDNDSLRDSDASSDSEGCCSEDEQDGPSPRKRVPWSELDEQRLRVWKQEKKSWKWIFKKFPKRTEAAVRTRWTMIQGAK